MATEMKAFKGLCERATKGPLHVYKGGNFVKLAAYGYDEYVARRHYLGGPLLVADVEDCATEDGEEDRPKALANAALLALSRNYVERLVESLIRRTSTCAGCEQCRADRALLAEIEEAAKGG